MKTEYELENIEDLIAFDRDCCSAICKCPQQSNYPTLTSIDSRISIASIFERFFTNRTLWHCGYNEFLSKLAVNTFKRYALLRYGNVVDLKTGKIFNKKEEFLLKKTVEIVMI